MPLSSHAIQMWWIHSISSLTPVLDNLKRVSFAFLRRKWRRRYTSRNKKIQGMAIEEGQWKEVMVKAVIMEMTGKQTGE